MGPCLARISQRVTAARAEPRGVRPLGFTGVGRVRALGTVLTAAALLVGCNLDTDFAENMVEKQAERNQQRYTEQQREELPLPDPTIVEYKSYLAEDLVLDENFKVNLVDDLVLGEGRTGPEYLFVRFSGRGSALGNVAVDDQGRFFVLETRSAEVRVFDRDGDFLYKFGQPGQGPGDFQRPYGMVIAGDHVTVLHRSYFSSIWTLGDDFVRDRETLRTPEAQEAARLQAATEGTMATSRAESQRRTLARRFRVPTQVLGQPDGSMIMVIRAEPTGPGGRISTPYVLVVGRFEDGAETRRYIEVPEWASPSLAVSLQGDMYIAMFGHLRTERYILALDPAGEPRFVIITPWNVDMPPGTQLRVDGQGRLYAFPTAQVPEEDPRRPVHVFSRDGDLLGSGFINRRPVWTQWQVTTPNRVYGVRVDPDTDEWEVVRYRLEIDER